MNNAFIKRNFMMILAACLVVAMAIMAYITYFNFGKGEVSTDKQTRMLETQGESTEIEDIEKDLVQTDFKDIDKEITDIEEELSLPID